ncbi:MAG: secretion protein HylD [Betaproteobacteria bacterium HGW-Betaproteobacteria-13]|jgi:putative peptide zinc metalloprotease protein|nr:MAG: secretion protein HylD [Betaproteobacteria bacterium HGW-Betaproteobacteria-21]PKO82062.1 MAG: secretion protein HylD [Betaproteobacteria bacterium HGW-Betaproteobacteria-13]
MALPPLREELSLHPGPKLSDGQPSWTLQDPVRNQFFRLDWQTFEVLSRWSLGTEEAIVEAVSRSTTLELDASDVTAVLQFLLDNQLVQPTGDDTAKRFAARYRASKGTWLNWLLHHYLFFRIPLIKPDRLLDRMSPAVEVFFSKTFRRLTIGAVFFGLISVIREWERFSATLVDTLSWEGLFWYGVTLVGVKTLHEFGHAFTAKRYGCRIPAMGVAFLVMWPMAYTDTNEVWKLADRRKRFAVAGAGVMTELYVAAWATLAWALLPDGLPKAMAFMLATTSWIATIAINSSPFMRFDGYFLVSDWLDLPNLHSRSFALARWDLRERLFGLGIEPPEFFTPSRQRGLILFGWATWIYRLLLFIGIAVLVYHFFIKAVGIFLFLVELIWFIAKPVWGEVKVWRQLWPVIRERRRFRRSGAIMALVLITLLVPWPSRLTATGVFKPVESFVIYAPGGAQVTKLPWRDGDEVSAGAVLMELASPSLVLRWEQAQARLQQMKWRAAAADVDSGERQNLQVLQQAELSAQAELESVKADIELHSPRAPFSGLLRDTLPDLNTGSWVHQREALATLVNPETMHVEAYVDENAVRRVQLGDSARFFADGLGGPFLELTVASIDADATRSLPDGRFATQFGGSIVVREKRGELIPDQAVYRILLSVDEPPGALAGQTWRGKVVILGAWEAPASRYFRSALSILWREAGF